MKISSAILGLALVLFFAVGCACVPEMHESAPNGAASSDLPGEVADP